MDVCGSHVAYRFATDEYDISFGVFFQGLDGKVSERAFAPNTNILTYLWLGSA